MRNDNGAFEILTRRSISPIWRHIIGKNNRALLSEHLSNRDGERRREGGAKQALAA